MKWDIRIGLAANVAVALLLCATRTDAVDGVIEINDASIIAAGGYPLVIGASGSFVLTGNLTPPANTDAIDIVTNGVTLDLNGFEIIQSTPGPSTGIGIDGSGGSVTTVRNGTVRGFTTIGINVTGGSVISQVRVVCLGGGVGIGLGNGSVARDSFVADCATGIAATQSRVESNTIVGNSAWGVVTGVGSNFVMHNLIQSNATGGIYFAGDGDTNIQDNTIRTNGGFGISDAAGPPPPPPPSFVAHRALIRGNTIINNTGPGISLVGPALISNNSVSQNGIGVNCGSLCTLEGNTIDSNGGGGASVGDGSNVTGNSISFNTGFGLTIPVTSGYSQNTLNANGIPILGPDVIVVPAVAHPTSGFMNLCSGVAGPAATCP